MDLVRRTGSRGVRAGLQHLVDGRPGESLATLERRTRWLMLVGIGGANIIGAVIVFVFATVVIPSAADRGDPMQVLLVNGIVFVGYLAIAVPVGAGWGLRQFQGARQFMAHGGVPTERQQLIVLRGPRRLMVVHAVLWSIGIVLFTLLNLTFSPLLALKAGLTALLGGTTTCAVIYLITERLLRTASALALSVGLPERRPGLPNVTTRAMLSWGLGAAVPVLGLVFVATAALVLADFTATQLAVIILALGGITLSIGFGVTLIAARAVADPITSVRVALARVERGDLTAEVSVYDGSEVGQLQAGFNHMVAGLREHERLRDLFGRHVGQDVARRALERGIVLGGESRTVSVIFVDLVDSTRLAATMRPAEVVAILNTFFGIVVNVIDRGGGWINKFQGDAALAIFGAPQELDDAPTRALTAARELDLRLRREVPQLNVGIGVACGEVIAGNIGAEQRFEYTVIGDPVNEAARLTELAKATPQRVLASAAVLAGAHAEEAARWSFGDTVTLRGRTEPTRLAAPAAA